MQAILKRKSCSQSSYQIVLFITFWNIYERSEISGKNYLINEYFQSGRTTTDALNKFSNKNPLKASQFK